MNERYLFGIGMVLAMLMVFTAPAAAENRAYFDPVHSNATIGNTTWVTLYVDIDTNVRLAGGQVELKFDPAHADIIECKKACSPVPTGPNQYCWGALDKNYDFTGNGYLWGLVFVPQQSKWDSEWGMWVWTEAPGGYITGPATVPICKYKLEAVGTPGESPFDFGFERFPSGCSLCQPCMFCDEVGVSLSITWENGTFTHLAGASMPDLTVTAIGTPVNLRKDVINPISATVKNMGSENATSFVVTLEVNGSIVDTATVTSLNASENTTVEFLWTPSSTGGCTLNVTADANCEVTESDETNNSRIATETVLDTLTATVNVRIEGKDDTVWCEDVTFNSSVLTASDGSIHYLNEPTALGALDCANKSGGFGYVLENSVYGLYVPEINSEPSIGWDGWMYHVDYVSPWVGAGEYTLSGDEDVLWYFGAWTAPPLKIELNRTTVMVGGEFVATVTAYNDSTAAFDTVDAAEVYVDGALYGLTGTDGTLTMSLATAGDYQIHTDKGTWANYTQSEKVDMTVTATATATYDFATGAGIDKWAYRYQTDAKPPAANDVPGIEFMSDTNPRKDQYVKISTDNRKMQSDSTDLEGYYAAHRFVFNITQPVEDILTIEVLWNGKGAHTDRKGSVAGATLYIWNGTGYEELDNTTSNKKVYLSAELTGGFGSYIDANGYLTVLVEQNSAQTVKGKKEYVSTLSTDYVKVDITHM